MNAKALALQNRTHEFLLRIIRFCEGLPANDVIFSIRPQLLDAAGSTDSNYRAACRGRTHAEFTAKVGVAAEEADEARGWLMALLDAGYGSCQEAGALIQEAEELTKILTASQKTATQRKAAVAAARKHRPS
jgi:four helix bundle protein